MDEYVSKEIVDAEISKRAFGKCEMCGSRDTCSERRGSHQYCWKPPQFPVIDAEPVRHGVWLDIKEIDLYVPAHKFTVTKTTETCSECKVRIGFIGAKLYLFDGYCPNCHAKMDGGTNNG